MNAGASDDSLAPEWVADDVDVSHPWLEDGPDADTDPERNKHALVPKGTRFRVEAVFDVSGPTGLIVDDILAWAECSLPGLALGSDYNAVTLQQSGSQWKGVFQITTAPTEIGVLADFQWTWHVDISDEIPDATVSSSQHTVLVNKSAFTGGFAGYKPYDWVAWLSSAWAAGKTTDAAIGDAIGTKAVEDNQVGTVIPGVNFDYEFPVYPALPCETRKLLQYRYDPRDARWHRFGSCGDLSDWFVDLYRVQSIQPTRHGVEASGAYSFWGTSKSDRDSDFGPGFAKNGQWWNPDAEFMFPDNFVWVDHAFVEYGGKIYDPSAGQVFQGGWGAYFGWLHTDFAKVDMSPPYDWVTNPDRWTWTAKDDLDSGELQVVHFTDGVPDPSFHFFPPFVP